MSIVRRTNRGRKDDDNDNNQVEKWLIKFPAFLFPGESPRYGPGNNRV